MKRKKQFTLTVVVSGPSWMTKGQAKQEVRALINDQCFHGSRRPGSYDEIDESNFRARSVR